MMELMRCKNCASECLKLTFSLPVALSLYVGCLCSVRVVCVTWWCDVLTSVSTVCAVGYAFFVVHVFHSTIQLITRIVLCPIATHSVLVNVCSKLQFYHSKGSTTCKAHCSRIARGWYSNCTSPLPMRRRCVVLVSSSGTSRW